MKNKTILIFYSIFFLVFFGAFFYILSHALSGLELYGNYRIYFSCFFSFLALTYPVSRILDQTRLNLLHDIFYWVGAFGFAIILYSFLIVVIVDLVRFLNLLISFLPEKGTHKYLELKFYFFLLISVLIFSLLVIGFINARCPHVKKIKLSIPKRGGKYNNLKILLASDIHMGVLFGKKRIRKMVNEINSMNPDLVLFAGDIIDEVIRPVIRNHTGEPLLDLKPEIGVYAITGNHEFIGGIHRTTKYIESVGVTFLRDEAILIDESFYLVGREDKDSVRFVSNQRKTLSELLDGIDKSKPIIMMDHQPFNLHETEKASVDLQLSGHTHHGQFWPLNLITKKVFEVSQGYLKKGASHIYVSNGYGFWGPPIRIGNRPELVFITLEFFN
jgi:uncharacterized protein